MKLKYFIAAIITITISLPALAQNKKADSLKLVTIFRELLSICKNVDFADPKVRDSGTFYKAAPYIIYRGDDKQRAGKDFVSSTQRPLPSHKAIERDCDEKLETFC